MVISHMDMQAATRFASMSRACRALVNSRKIYHENLQFAGKALRAIVTTDTLQHHSMTKVNEVLKASHCAKCSNLGDLLFHHPKIDNTFICPPQLCEKGQF